MVFNLQVSFLNMNLAVAAAAAASASIADVMVFIAVDWVMYTSRTCLLLRLGQKAFPRLFGFMLKKKL